MFNTRLDRSKLNKKEHTVVKSPTAIAGRDQLNSAQFSVLVGYFSSPLFNFSLRHTSIIIAVKIFINLKSKKTLSSASVMQP